MYNPRYQSQPQPYPRPRPAAALPPDAVGDVPLINVADGATIRFEYGCTAKALNGYSQKYERPQYIDAGAIATVAPNPWRGASVLIVLADGQCVTVRSSLRVTVIL